MDLDYLTDLPHADDTSPDVGAELLDGITRYLRNFVVFSDDAQVAAVALWVVHTHAIDAARSIPYLSISSAEWRSGKTRLLEVLELLAARPWRVFHVTPAVLFRKIDQDYPTILLDEVDAIFEQGGASNQALRAVLNAGHRRGGVVARVVKDPLTGDYVVRDFDVFAPKAFAGIGRPLPDTVADRSIPPSSAVGEHAIAGIWVVSWEDSGRALVRRVPTPSG